MCVPWELNPQHFALLSQCSTTEPQEHCPPHGLSEQIYSAGVSTGIPITEAYLF